MEILNKTEIVNNALKRMSTDEQQKLSASTGYELFSNCLIEIAEQLAQGNKVTLNGFGRFVPFERKGYDGVLPWKSNEKVTVKGRYVPKFYAADKFKNKVMESISIEENTENTEA